MRIEMTRSSRCFGPSIVLALTPVVNQSLLHKCALLLMTSCFCETMKNRRVGSGQVSAFAAERFAQAVLGARPLCALVCDGKDVLALRSPVGEIVGSDDTRNRPETCQS